MTSWFSLRFVTSAFCVSLIVFLESHSKADVVVGASQISTVASVTVGKKSLSVLNFAGFGLDSEFLFANGFSGRLGYQAHLAEASLFLHGPSLMLGYQIYGGRDYRAETENYRIEEAYPFELKVSAGPYLRFHDFSTLLLASERAFNAQKAFAEKGLAIGAVASFSVSKNVFQSSSVCLEFAFITATARAIAAEAVFEGYLLHFGLQNDF